MEMYYPGYLFFYRSLDDQGFLASCTIRRRMGQIIKSLYIFRLMKLKTLTVCAILLLLLTSLLNKSNIKALCADSSNIKIP